MDLNKAFVESIRQYFEGQEPEEYKKSVGARRFKYGKKYFDNMEKEFNLVEDKESDEESE